MAAILRAVALGLLGLALTLHVVGFVTNAWISANLDKRGMENIMSANGMGMKLPGQVGLNINMGLWKFCMHINLGIDAQSVPGLAASTDMCQKPKMEDIPDWMRAVQALGILSMIAAALGVALLIYGFLGESKGDRARLLPFIQGAVILLAGVLLLIGVVVYAAEYNQMMKDQMSMMGSEAEEFRQLYENVAQHTGLGYSFALETVAGVLMVLATLVIAIPGLRAVVSGSPHNLAV